MNALIKERLKIEYRNRKSLEIQIKPSGIVRVLAPMRASEKWVMDAISAKERWIIEKLGQQSSRVEEKPKLENASQVLDRGSFVTLEIGSGQGIYPVQRLGDKLQMNVIKQLESDTEVLTKLLVDWYTNNTKLRVQEYINKWSKVLDVNPKQVKIKDQKRRWGSCSSRGNLNFNWRLSMAPDDVLEYVVVHELCHFHEMNHSKVFWSLVKQCIPDYKTKKEWLKTNGASMFWLG